MAGPAYLHLCIRKASYSLALTYLGLAATPSAAVEFPYLYRSAYFIGRGDTGIAIADDEEAVFYNPAGLAQGKGIYKQTILAAPMAEFSRTARDVARQIGLQKDDPINSFRGQEGIPQHVGVNQFSGVLLRRAAIGAFAHSSTTAMLYKDYKKGALETIHAEMVSDVGMTFSLAHVMFGKNSFMGLTAKYIKRTQGEMTANATETNQVKEVSADERSMLGTGMGVDLGIQYRSPSRTPMSFGLTVQDVGNTAFSPDKPTTVPKGLRPLKDIKQTVNVGLAIEPGTKHSRFKILADVRDVADATKQVIFKKVHIGAELTVNNLIGFSAGINQGYGAFGFYLDTRFVRFDVGGYAEEFGETTGSRPDQRYYVKLAVGI